MSSFDELRIRELRFFDRLAKLGTITAAARDLGIPKPTASRWLAEVERKVGQPLVHRTTRQMALTEGGQWFAERVRELLHLADAAARASAVDPAGGTLRVSVPIPLGRMIAGALVASFRAQLPAVQLVIKLQNERVDLVRDGIDVAIRGGPLPDSELVARKLASMPLWLYASAGGPTQHEDDAGGFDPRATALIAAPGDARLLARTRTWRLTPAAILDDRMAIADALIAGAGFGLLPPFLGEPAREAGDLVRVDSRPVTTLAIHALYLAAQRGDLRVRVFIDELEAHLHTSMS